jgi:hypothetical protein
MTPAYSTVGIVEEENSCKDCVVTTTTSDYGMVGDNDEQGLLDCPQDAVDSSFAAINRDMDKGFVRVSEKTRSLQPSTGTIGPAWSPGTFQPPARCQDCVLGVASQGLSCRNITPTSLKVCHVTEYTSHSTDCTSLSTDCQGLPDKSVLPDVVVLPDVDKTVFLASWGRNIVGSENTIGSGMPRSQEPEVPGLYVASCSQHTIGLD